MGNKFILGDLSYKITGICFKIHNKLGRFCSERQYSNKLEEVLKENNIGYKREFEIAKLVDSPLGNRPDFIIKNKIILDVKAKKFITKEDYYQMLRYLIAAKIRLGLIVNFRNTYLKPKRVLNSQL
ncbi:MAG: GxxExxY protein [Patescibacteria group bacterium]